MQDLGTDKLFPWIADRRQTVSLDCRQGQETCFSLKNFEKNKDSRPKGLYFVRAWQPPALSFPFLAW